MWAGFIILAAICDAIMDSLYKVHIGETIFPESWAKETTSPTAKRILKWKLDPWHIAKSLRITFSILSAVFYENYFGLRWYAEVGIAGSVWILTFNLFYNKVFKK